MKHSLYALLELLAVVMFSAIDVSAQTMRQFKVICDSAEKPHEKEINFYNVILFTCCLFAQ